MYLIQCDISALKMETPGFSKALMPIFETTLVTPLNFVRCQDNLLLILKSLLDTL